LKTRYAGWQELRLDKVNIQVNFILAFYLVLFSGLNSRTEQKCLLTVFNFSGNSMSATSLLQQIGENFSAGV
jgi:hypothetical protein